METMAERAFQTQSLLVKGLNLIGITGLASLTEDWRRTDIVTYRSRMHATKSQITNHSQFVLKLSITSPKTCGDVGSKLSSKIDLFDLFDLNWTNLTKY